MPKNLKQPKDSALVDIETGKFLKYNSKEDIWELNEFVKPKRAGRLIKLLQALSKLKDRQPENLKDFSKELTKEKLNNLTLVEIRLSYITPESN